MPHRHRFSYIREASEIDLPDRELECKLNDPRSSIIFCIQGKKNNKLVEGTRGPQETRRDWLDD